VVKISIFFYQHTEADETDDDDDSASDDEGT